MLIVINLHFSSTLYSYNMNYLSMLMLKSYFLSENETCVGVERIKFKLKGQLET